MPLTCVLFALLSAAVFAIAIDLQHGRAVHHTAAAGDSAHKRWMPVLAGIAALVRDPVWQLGWVFSGVGFALHATALHYGPIAVVQAILVLQLLLAIVIGDLRRHLKPSLRECLAATSVSIGIVLVVVQRSDAGRRAVEAADALTFLLAAAVAVVVLVVLARRFSGRLRGLMIGVAAGSCFTGTAINLAILTARLSDHGLSGLLHWSLAALVTTSMSGTILMQDAFASGALPPSLTAMTVTDPLLGALAGAVLFDAARPSAFQLTVGLPAAAVLIAVGVAFLARTPVLREELGQGAGEPPTREARRTLARQQ